MTDESFGVGRIGGGQGSPPCLQQLWCLTAMDRGRGQQGQTPMMMLVVVPREEFSAELQPVLLGGKAVGEVGSVLEGLELTF